MKNIVLTGASDGLGKQLAKLYIANGFNVIALCRNKPEYGCDFIKVDLTDENDMISACDLIKEKYNKIDALINCAGVPGIEKLEEITYSCLDNLIKINSIAPMFLISQLIELIKKSEADIINIGSTIGLKQGYENQLAYTTSKWALRGTSYNLQLELKKFNCRVMHFNIGGMNTRMHEKYTGKKIENPDEWMDPKDIAGIIFYTSQLPKNIEISEIVINRKKKSE